MNTTTTYRVEVWRTWFETGRGWMPWGIREGGCTDVAQVLELCAKAVNRKAMQDGFRIIETVTTEQIVHEARVE